MPCGDVNPCAGRGISVIHDDVLWEIFFCNASIYSTDRCLQTTRWSSQVCRNWRWLILSSKYLWGRLLDLRELDQKTDRWRQEVLRRSADSLLWIRGTVPGSPSDPRPGTLFFFSVLEVHWSRIQHLRLEVIEPRDERAWRHLQLPAPHLRSCDLITNYLNVPVVFDETIVPPFKNKEPWLRNYTFSCIFLGLEASWISRLRTLDICSPLTNCEILYALQLAPQLEILGISGLVTHDYFGATPHSVSLPTVNLPNLTQFRLFHGRIISFADFLEYIRPAIGCTLSIMAEVGDDIASMKTELNLVSKLLSPYVERHMRAQTVTDIQVNLAPQAFWFWDCTTPRSRPLLFRIVITSLLEFSSDTYDFLPSLLAKGDFSSVTNLSLDLPPLLPLLAVAYFPFFSSFSDLTTLTVNEHTLRTVLAMPATPGKPVFPALHTLGLGSFEAHPPNANDIPAISLFLRRRKEIGIPIEKLDLRLTEWKEASKIIFLKDIVGLRVILLPECK